MLNRMVGAGVVAAMALVAAWQAPQGKVGCAACPRITASFDGLAGGRNPSDNSLAVGPDRVVQIVNSRLEVFDKAGKVLYGPAPTNSIFKGFGGTCEARNNGDAVVRYDQLAGRWLFVMPIFSKIADRPDEPYSMCYAVSAGGDPTGPYHRYEFRRKLFPDYPRPAIWPDGYYIPTSTGDNVIQKHACVADRAKMLAGKPATEQCVVIDNVNFLNNADIDGQGLPPAGAPNIMMAAGGTQLHGVFEDDGIYFWTFHVDWANPKNTKVSEMGKIPVAPYHYLCNGQLTNCVPQPGVATRLDAQGDKLMQRLVYRNVNGHESIVAVHSVNSPQGAGGVRWYEFRLDAKRSPQLFQQGTYAPDGFYRWMASPGMDRQGDIAIGYSFGGTPNFPGQRVAARLAGDPPGQMGGETVVVEGEAAQETGNRWEDYTTMAMDPSDDCTFWYVGDYVKKGAPSYSTRIAAFRLPGCLRGTVSGAAYLDLNHDGKRQEGEPGIAGKTVTYSGADSGRAVTDKDGAYQLSLPADSLFADPTYTVASKTIHVKDGDRISMDFPEVCTVKSAGAMGAKFWMGSKGQDAVNRHYGEWKKLVGRTLYLVDADGVRFIPKRYAQLQAWLKKPPSPLLAAQTVAGLNAECGGLDGNATVMDPVAKDWVSVHALIQRVSEAYQAKDKGKLDDYKSLLDRLNENTAEITPSDPAKCGASAAEHLGGIRQLTHGGQNAEAYWAPDGKRLIFQTTRPPYDCDQMFVMNADGSDQHLVSTGKGRTTCGYFLADNQHIVYASTHLADAACPTNPDRSKGYVWGVFPGYDIFLATDDGKIEKRLTETPGYDAEATVNWKTGNIVYTSLASRDLDLWTMKSDGSAKRQLTKAQGYDGGAVFSRDGKKLVWRSNYPKTPTEMDRYKSLLAENLTAPMKMEIMVGNADGSGAHAVTNFGCASFAPTFTPDGKKILFSSNKHDCDSRHFELYLINVDGTGLEQVTHSGGFTSFPEFSPDGKTLVFCSDQDAKERYEFNIFTARWQ